MVQRQKGVLRSLGKKHFFEKSSNVLQLKHRGVFFTPHTVTYFQLFSKNARDFPGDVSHHVRNEPAGARTSSPHRQQQSLQPKANSTGRASRVIP